METKRGNFDEIISIDGIDADTIIGKYKDVIPERQFDLDSKRRGTALNIDLYGYDPAQDVDIIQIRQYYKRSANAYPDIRKDYAMVGTTEMGTLFRHPVGAHAVRRNSKGDAVLPVRAAQRWMFNVTEAQLARSTRQGDVLLTRERSGPRGEVAELGTTIIVGGSHAVFASRIVKDAKGTVWALDPVIRHSKGQHAPISGDDVDTWNTVRLAREAPTWSFTGGRLQDVEPLAETPTNSAQCPKSASVG